MFRARQQSLQGARKKGDQDGYKEKTGQGQEGTRGEVADACRGPLAAGTPIQKGEVNMATKKKLAKGKKAPAVKPLIQRLGR